MRDHHTGKWVNCDVRYSNTRKVTFLAQPEIALFFRDSNHIRLLHAMYYLDQFKPEIKYCIANSPPLSEERCRGVYFISDLKRAMHKLHMAYLRKLWRQGYKELAREMLGDYLKQI